MDSGVTISCPQFAHELALALDTAGMAYTFLGGVVGALVVVVPMIYLQRRR